MSITALRKSTTLIKLKNMSGGAYVPFEVGYSSHPEGETFGGSSRFATDGQLPGSHDGRLMDIDIRDTSFPTMQRQDVPARHDNAAGSWALPPDASATLYVEGIPADCKKREAAHIFRPFIGFKEVRLVYKDVRRPGGEPLVLCFVDFADALCAMTALEALQGYKLDENDRDGPSLRLQFARVPGPRTGFPRDKPGLRPDYRFRKG